MGEEGTHAAEHFLKGRFFAVREDPYCVWDWDLLDRNIQYLKSLDPHYFDYVAKANYAHLDAEDAGERRRAALPYAQRTTMGSNPSSRSCSPRCRPPTA